MQQDIPNESARVSAEVSPGEAGAAALPMASQVLATSPAPVSKIAFLDQLLDDVFRHNRTIADGLAAAYNRGQIDGRDETMKIWRDALDRAIKPKSAPVAKMFCRQCGKMVAVEVGVSEKLECSVCGGDSLISAPCAKTKGEDEPL